MLPAVPAGMPVESIQLVRDPIDRYVSSYHSKYRCCGEPEGAVDPWCIAGLDVNDRKRMVPDILRLAEVDSPHASVPCLTWSEFVSILSKVHTMGKSRYLDVHVLPQTITSCGFSADATKMTIKEFARQAPQLAARYGRYPAIVPYTHHSDRIDSDATGHEADLCPFVAEEYRWVGMRDAFEDRCRPIHQSV